MKRGPRIARLWIAIGVAPLLALALPAATAPMLDANARADVAATLDQRWPRLAGEPPANLNVRELFGFALEAAGSGWHPTRLEHIFSAAARYQDREPGSKTRGNLRWTYGESKVNDENAVEFTMQVAALIWSFYRDQLTPTASTQLKEIIDQAIPGIRSHAVKESYTNIFLMKAWNCIALGEGLRQPELANEGYAMLSRWIGFTARNGISEYLSPTYTGVALDSLGLVARWAGRESGRADARAALGLIWSSLAANWFSPAERLGGAHSRDYDYLTGHGRLENHIRFAGWTANAAGTLTASALGGRRIFYEFCRWSPPEELRRAAAPEPARIVVERFGAQPWERIVHYVGRQFTLGSAGATYGNLDKPVTMCFAGGPRVPMLNMFMDGRADPYGQKKIATRSTQEKAMHLTPFLASVHRGREMLVVLALDPAAKNVVHNRSAVVQLTTQVVLPLMDAVFIGGVPAGLDDVSVPAGETLVLVKGDVVLGIRVLHARGDRGADVPVRLHYDGSALGACRLAIEHATTQPVMPGSAALWLRAAEGLDARGVSRFVSTFAHARAEVAYSGDHLSITAAEVESSLGMVLDLARGKRISLTGGEPSAEALLQINGEEIGRSLLSSAPSLKASR